MKARRSTGKTAAVALALALLLGAVAGLAACGGSDEQAASPSASPISLTTSTPEPYVSSWEAGTDGLAATRAVAARYLAALESETVSARADTLYAEDATLDNLIDATVTSDRDAIRTAWEGWEDGLQWMRGDTMYVAPGVAVHVAAVTDDRKSPTMVLPNISMIAVSGGKIAHEEILGDPRESIDITRGWQALTADPGPKDTAAAARRAADFVAKVCSQTGDFASLQKVYARDIVFLDASRARPLHGVDAAIAWHEATTRIEGADMLTFDPPITGPGWAVLRWTVSGTTADGGNVSLPGVTVMELRGGKIARSMFFYDSSVLDLSS